MKKLLLGSLGALLAVGALNTALAQTGGVLTQPITLTVDCSRGQTVSAALGRLWTIPMPIPVVISIRGTCNEFVTISRDNVTLHGDPSAAITAPNGGSDLVVVNADGVTLENLTLTGGNYGVRNNHVLNLAINNSVIQGSQSDGVHVLIGDTRLVGSTIQNAGGYGIYAVRGGTVAVTVNSHVLSSAGAGVYGVQHAAFTIFGSTISDNGSHGVFLDAASQGSIINSTIANNGRDPNQGGDGIHVYQSQATITSGSNIVNNRQDGIGVIGGSVATIDNSNVQGNGHHGVDGYLAPAIVMHADTISGNGFANHDGMGIYCVINCTLQIGGSTISGNAVTGINLAIGSSLYFEEPKTNGTGNGGADLWCGDASTHVTNLGSFIGTSPTCTPF